MGRWTSHFRDQQPRGWMIPGHHAGGPVSAAGDAAAAGPSGARGGVVVLEPPEAAAVRPRGPLRRQVGVPAPLETPLFVHRAALSRLELERRRQRRTLAAVIGASVAASVALRAFMGG